jgi:hypothetical protein
VKLYRVAAIPKVNSIAEVVRIKGPPIRLKQLQFQKQEKHNVQTLQLQEYRPGLMT